MAGIRDRKEIEKFLSAFASTGAFPELLNVLRYFRDDAHAKVTELAITALENAETESDALIALGKYRELNELCFFLEHFQKDKNRSE